MATKELYAFRKANGLCTDCGRVADKRLCTTCTKAHSRYQKMHPFKGERKTPKKPNKKYQKQWHSKRPEYNRDIAYQRKYNMSLLEVEQQRKLRNNICDICGKQVEKLHVDHVIIDGEVLVRGMLCMSCNVGLGHFKDNSKLLQEAIRYLQKQNLIKQG